MNKLNVHQVLVAAFRSLPKADRCRLEWHRVNKTPICCGERADMFIDGSGDG